MAQIGNAANQKLNKEWGRHVPGKRRLWKRYTAKLRRRQGRDAVSEAGYR